MSKSFILLQNYLRKRLRATDVAISSFVNTINSYIENLKRPQTSPLRGDVIQSYLLLEEYLHKLSFKMTNSKYRIFSDQKFISEYIIHSLLSKINITRRNNVYLKPESCKEIQAGLIELETNLSTIQGHLNTVVSNFKYFNIQEDVVGADECELSIIIPRDQVENNLTNLGKELIEFEKNISVFSEIATGSREPLQVRTIASSDFSIFLDSVPAIGALVAFTIERILALYKQSIEIKKIET